MVDNFARNNWIIIIVIVSAIILISITMFGFIAMLDSIGQNINLVVNNTSKNMTDLTQILITEQRRGTVELDKVVENQTEQFIKSINNFTNVVIDYSAQNDNNLKNIYNLVSDINNKTINITN
jgi:predicted PurR-regulated permease PerM